jgi:hypothetical protein
MPAESGAIDERGLVLLRRKLEALNYTQHCDASSAALVSQLVNDLIRTTDSYRSIKLQAAQYAQEVAAFNTKVCASYGCAVHACGRCRAGSLPAPRTHQRMATPAHERHAQLDVVKADCGRLAAENNQLHERLLRDAERAEQAQRQAAAGARKLEGQLAELSAQKAAAASRAEGLERDNTGLRRKVAELLRLGERRSKAGNFEPVDEALRITLPQPLSECVWVVARSCRCWAWRRRRQGRAVSLHVRPPPTACVCVLCCICDARACLQAQRARRRRPRPRRCRRP